jgi:hypothetical protein
VKLGVAVWAGALALVAVAGFAAGWLIKGPAHPNFDFDTKAAPYQIADLPGGRTKAGFTGFDDVGGLAGAPIVAGKVTAVDAGSVTVATTSGSSVIRLTGIDKLRILQPFTSPIPNGATVVATKTDDGGVGALLVILDP